MSHPLPDAPYPADLLKLVEDYLVALDLGADRRAARLVEAMRYSLLAGGKRIRPVLTLATARSRGADPAAVLPAAAALELIHTYSLIHDDLTAIDDDTLRRARASALRPCPATRPTWPPSPPTSAAAATDAGRRPVRYRGAILVRRCGIWTRSPTPPTSRSSPSAN